MKACGAYRLAPSLRAVIRSTRVISHDQRERSLASSEGTQQDQTHGQAAAPIRHRQNARKVSSAIGGAAVAVRRDLLEILTDALDA